MDAVQGISTQFRSLHPRQRLSRPCRQARLREYGTASMALPEVGPKRRKNGAVKMNSKDVVQSIPLTAKRALAIGRLSGQAPRKVGVVRTITLAARRSLICDLGRNSSKGIAIALTSSSILAPLRLLFLRAAQPLLSLALHCSAASERSACQDTAWCSLTLAQGLDRISEACTDLIN